MMRWRVLVFLLLLASPAFAQDEKRAEALKHFQIGLELTDRQAWDLALAEFLYSRELFPTRNALKNAAVCLRKLNRLDEALDMYDELRARFGAELPEADKKFIDSEYADMSRFVGSLTVQSDPPGATVVVDGRERGVTPLAKPVRVTVGTRAVRVFKEGYAPFETRVMVPSGESRTVDAKLTVVSQVGQVRVREARGRVFEVVVDSAVVGVTPWQGQLTAGEHTIALRGDKDIGATPRAVEIKVGRLNDVTLDTGILPGELRIEPWPPESVVTIDGRVVGQGTISGQVASGAHQLEITAPWYDPWRDRVDVSSKSPQVVRVSLERIRRVYGELGGGFGYPSYGTTGVSNCSGTCLSNIGYVRGGYLLTRRLGVELFLLGIYMSHDSKRTLTITDQGTQATSTNYSETADLNFIAGGASVSYRLLDEQTPLTLRLWTGLSRNFASAGASGTFSDGTQRAIAATTTNYVTYVIGPEARIGYRFSRGVMSDIGVALLAYGVPTTQPASVSVLPTGPAFNGGVGWLVPVLLGLHVDL